MKYVYNGKYREYRGYVFWGNKPVTITDKGTLVAIQKEKDFAIYEAQPEKPENPDACPKCGRVIKQGKFMHQKYCKGKE